MSFRKCIRWCHSSAYRSPTVSQWNQSCLRLLVPLRTQVCCDEAPSASEPSSPLTLPSWITPLLSISLLLGFPGGSDGKESACNSGNLGFDPWVGKIPWRREQLPTPGFWPGEFHGLYSPWGHKESHMTEWLSLSIPIFKKGLYQVSM